MRKKMYYPLSIKKLFVTLHSQDETKGYEFNN